MEIYRIVLLFLLVSFLTRASGKDLLSCLSSYGVSNVTTYHNPTYPELLNSTIMNLRFSRRNAPKPLALIFPADRDQVSASIRCTRAASLTIRIRSGGHSYEGVSSTADTPFVIIDITNLDRVTVDLSTRTAWVESGATNGHLYYSISRYSNAFGFSAGVCPTVGIGGHFSGGGYGMLARKYGLAVDHVLDAILIDAEGRMLDRKAMGEEIFWAIRGGGGGSWGVVVAWKIELLPVPEKVAAFRFLRVGTASQAAELWYKWQMVAPKLEDEFFLNFRANPRTDAVGIAQGFLGLYLGPKASALHVLATAFPELNVTSDECREMSWAEAMVYLWGGSMAVEELKNRSSYRKDFFKVKSDYVQEPIPLGVLEAAFDMVAKQPKSSLLADPYGGYVNRVKSNAVAFPHRSNLFGIEYSASWEEAEDGNSDAYVKWVRDLYKHMTKYVSKKPRISYVNLLDLDLGTMDWKKPGLTGPAAVKLGRAWGKKYFLHNYDRLVRAKTMIDPFNVFNNPQSIPPLTSVST